MIRLLFVDETTSGDRDTAFALEVPDVPLTLRDVIRARVQGEAARSGAAGEAPGAGTLDARCETAFREFGRNGFLVLAGDRQLTGLDEPVPAGPEVEVTFLKLIPLVGG